MNVIWIDKQLAMRHMNRRELADKVGMTEVQVSKVMNGFRKLSLREADSIRRTFGYRLPEDPIQSDTDQIQEYLTRLNTAQRRSLLLYLEALMGDP